MEKFRGTYKTYRVAVLEGQGTPDDPMHIVNYIYDADTNDFIGEISMAGKKVNPKDRED